MSHVGHKVHAGMSSATQVRKSAHGGSMGREGCMGVAGLCMRCCECQGRHTGKWHRPPRVHGVHKRFHMDWGRLAGGEMGWGRYMGMCKRCRILQRRSMRRAAWVERSSMGQEGCADSSLPILPYPSLLPFSPPSPFPFLLSRQVSGCR